MLYVVKIQGSTVKIGTLCKSLHSLLGEDRPKKAQARAAALPADSMRSPTVITPLSRAGGAESLMLPQH